jgi:hypothetical protein
MSIAVTPPAAAASTGRRVRMPLAALFLLGTVVQFYLAGRGAFHASSDYSAHKSVGNILHGVSLLVLLATVAFADLRNRVDAGLAVALFLLMTLQAAIGTLEHPGIGALHPVNALLVTGAAAGIVSRDRRLAKA